MELILFSLLNGPVGVVVKLTHGLNPYAIVFSRAVIASVFLLGFMTIRKRMKEVVLHDPPMTIAVGVFQGISILLFFLALQKISVSNAVFLVYTAPIFSVILARLFLKETIDKTTIPGVILSVIGILFILDPRTLSINSASMIGNMLALGSGFLYAAMGMVAKPLTTKLSGYTLVFWQYLVISILFSPVLLHTPIQQFFFNWWQLFVIGIVSTGIAFVLFMEGVQKVKGQKVFIVTSLEPLVGTLAAAVMLKEIPSLFTVFGALLIFGGVYMVTTVQRKLI